MGRVTETINLVLLSHIRKMRFTNNDFDAKQLLGHLELLIKILLTIYINNTKNLHFRRVPFLLRN
jgi:hypothetical protein